MEDAHPLDKSKVIREAYQIEGIGLSDCRSIFLEFVLGLPDDLDGAKAAREMLSHYDGPADHPMTVVLQEAVQGRAKARRRGGAMGRRRREGPGS